SYWYGNPSGCHVTGRSPSPPRPTPHPPPPLNGPGYAPRQAVRGAPERGLKPAPRRLGHVLLFTSDIARQVDFYTRVLGLKLSDRSQEIIAFMRCTTHHHNPALLASTAPGFHHAPFAVGGVAQ